jgi:hypothetical protein
MAGFLEARRGCNSFDALLLDHLLENEKTIGRLQAATFRESYWRLYFLLNGGEAK